MQKRAKNKVFGHYLEIGVSDGLDIAYLDSRKCLSAFGNGKWSCIIDKQCMLSIIYPKMSQKLGFWPLSRDWGLRWTRYCIL